MITLNQEAQKFNSPVNFMVKKLKQLGLKKEERKKRIEFYYSGRAQNDGKSKHRNYLEYILRRDANLKLNLSKEEIFELYELKKTNLKEYEKKIENFKKTHEQNTGLWSKEGIVDDKRLDEIKQNLLKIDGENQFVWDTVISLDENFAQKYNLFNPGDIHDVLKERINMLFWSKNIDPEKVEWFFAHHNNTDNPHVHLLFFEKEPTRINGQFETIYNFDEKKILKDFKFKFARDLILNAKNIEINQFNKSRQNLVTYFRESLKEPLVFEKPTWQDVKEIYDDLSNDYNQILADINYYNRENRKEEFKKVNKLSYKLLSKTRKKEINKLIEHILKNDKSICEEFNQYSNNLQIYEDSVNEVNGNEKSKFKEESLYGDDGLYSRIGNKILHTIKRNIEVSERSVFVPKHHKKINKVKISIIDKLLKSINNFIFTTNQFLQIEINKTKSILESRGNEKWKK